MKHLFVRCSVSPNASACDRGCPGLYFHSTFLSTVCRARNVLEQRTGIHALIGYFHRTVKPSPVTHRNEYSANPNCTSQPIEGFKLQSKKIQSNPKLEPQNHEERRTAGRTKPRTVRFSCSPPGPWRTATRYQSFLIFSLIFVFLVCVYLF